MPVDSVDNYTVFRVIHSIAFRSSVFCSADKVREVVETRFWKVTDKCSKQVSTFRHVRIINIRFSFSVHIPNHTLRKLFCRFLVLSIPGERWILQTVPVFLFKSYCGFINIVRGVI